MNKYLSLVCLYSKASCRKIFVIAGVIPLGFLAIFLLRGGFSDSVGSFMLMERAFGGAWAVLLFIAVLFLGLMAVSTSLNGKKTAKGDCSTTGYTMRRLCLPPLAAYFTMLAYYLVIIVIFWGIATASLLIIGRSGLAMAGSPDLGTSLALGILRTEIGHALAPVAHPILIVFDIIVVLAFAGECARGCYLSWHNGTASAGAVLIIIPAFIVWTYYPKNSYLMVAVLVVFLYAALSFVDVVFREKRPKGDPFKVNRHDGIMDLDGTEYDDSVFLEVNTSAEAYDLSSESLIFEKYGKGAGGRGRKGLGRFNPFRLRRRFMPLGINMEKANAFFGACIFTGVAGHFVFYGKYMLRMDQIAGSIKGMTLDPSMQMPPFWEMQEHAYYGYAFAIVAALVLQSCWNYQYYNKTTKSAYVMKRLPDSREYLRTIWAGPAVQALMIVAIMAVQTLADLCIYAFVTPDIALPADYLSQIMPF